MKLLVVDDEPSILEVYRCALAPAGSEKQADKLMSMASSLFGDGDGVPEEDSEAREIAYCTQGLDAVDAARKAVEEGAPYEVAFIDVRMPPGIDGKETAKRIRAIDPDINIVIVTAYSDHNVTDICAVAGPADKIFYISKPFAADEVMQMARALSGRWHGDQKKVEELQRQMAELAASEARAQHMANHDFLTGIPNRLAFLAELAARLKAGKRDLALAMLDLDRFKQVNDVFGHAAGDDLLIQVSEKLRAMLPEQARLARLGGDEFAILIETPSQEEAVDICSSLLQECAQSYSIFGSTVHVGTSIGLVMGRDYPDNDVADLMRFADMALFQAKRDGRGLVRLYDSAMDNSAKFRQSIEEALRTALANGELSLHYQPIVDRMDLRTRGFEALLRWHNPVHGDISPSVFIPIAEESALIHEIGRWVIRNAIRDSLNWPELFVSINLSWQQFRRADVIQLLSDTAEEFGVEPGRVQIEITESAVFENSAKAQEIVAELQRRGFRIALDDFGTGYSTLLNVKNLMLDCIKIDKSFIDDLGVDKQATVIVNSITHLAKGLGLSVVAEGVETENQCQALRVVGCSHMQGHLFGAADTLDHSIDRYHAEHDAAPAKLKKAAG